MAPAAWQHFKGAVHLAAEKKRELWLVALHHDLKNAVILGLAGKNLKYVFFCGVLTCHSWARTWRSSCSREST
jgi:hypothetical protein